MGRVGGGKIRISFMMTRVTVGRGTPSMRGMILPGTQEANQQVTELHPVGEDASPRETLLRTTKTNTREEKSGPG